MSKSRESSFVRVPLAGFLAWLVPGLGHIYVGERARGVVLFVAIAATFWTGVAVGGVQDTVNRDKRKLWYVAQLCAGGHTLGATVLQRASAPPRTGAKVAYAGSYLAAEVGVHYTGVAGLLNVLVILDAIALADPRGGRRHVPQEAP